MMLSTNANALLILAPESTPTRRFVMDLTDSWSYGQTADCGGAALGLGVLCRAAGPHQRKPAREGANHVEKVSLRAAAFAALARSLPTRDSRSGKWKPCGGARFVCVSKRLPLPDDSECHRQC